MIDLGINGCNHLSEFMTHLQVLWGRANVETDPNKKAVSFTKIRGAALDAYNAYSMFIFVCVCEQEYGYKAKDLQIVFEDTIFYNNSRTLKSRGKDLTVTFEQHPKPKGLLGPCLLCFFAISLFIV